jgi:hypothetical protein
MSGTRDARAEDDAPIRAGFRAAWLDGHVSFGASAVGVGGGPGPEHRLTARAEQGQEPVEAARGDGCHHLDRPEPSRLEAADAESGQSPAQ